MKLLLADGNIGNLILIIVLLVACVIMFVLSYFKNKKYMQSQQELLNDLKVGSKVLTKTFIYGTIEKITETTDGKIVLIKTGEGDKTSFIEMNIEGIYSVDKKEEVVDINEVMEDTSNETERSSQAFEVKEELETDVETSEKQKRKSKTRK